MRALRVRASLCFLLTAAKSGTTENNLFHHLLGTNRKDLLGIPTESHLGDVLHLDIGLALKKIVALVSSLMPAKIVSIFQTSVVDELRDLYTQF